MDIGLKIKTARQEKGMTQEELGNILGVQKSAIAKYESGRVVNIKRSTLKKLSDILGIPPFELIFDEKKENSEAGEELTMTFKKETTADRLSQIMKERELRQTDVVNLCAPFCQKYNVRFSKSDLSQYLAGKAEPGQRKLTILGLALNVSETWLMGLDVPMERVAPPTKSEALTEGESALVELFRRVPEDKQKLVLGMIRSALENL